MTMRSLVCLVALWICFTQAVAATRSLFGDNKHNSDINAFYRGFVTWRGGANKRTSSKEDPFVLVARAIQDRLASEIEGPDPPTVAEIVDAFSFLSSSQQTFKGLDGAAHEAYQRTHAGDDVDLSVRGRARRSAARAAATANGLGACELCELLSPEVDQGGEFATVNGTLVGRQVLLNITASESTVLLGDSSTKISVIVLHEPIYKGGAGVFHGGIDDGDNANNKETQKGRLLIIVGDELGRDLTKIIQILDRDPKQVQLNVGLLSSEVASVQPNLYKAAGSLLETLEPTLRKFENQTSAIHFVGRSLAGGVANLAAIMLDGSLPLPSKKMKSSKKRKSKSKLQSNVERLEDTEFSSDGSDNNNANETVGNTTQLVPLSGLGKDRTSSISIGAPPCVSSNVQSDFVTSIMYGDDVVCRTSRASIDRLLRRSRKALSNKGWIGGRQLNFMTDTLSLTVSSLKTHAHGSEGEELRLAVPGKAYLLRPRRLGGICSIHEVGSQLKGGREALRTQVLWQLDDILLSKSLAKHHELVSYIHGLDRAQLRGFSGDENEEE